MPMRACRLAKSFVADVESLVMFTISAIKAVNTHIPVIATAMPLYSEKKLTNSDVDTGAPRDGRGLFGSITTEA